MKPLVAFIKKEYMEAARTGRLTILALLFALFGVMAPAMAKLTPWMMKTLSDTLAESGLIVTDVQMDALDAWAQFFKNIPLALMAFALLFSDSFTREYRAGTLLLALTRGLSRYKVVLAKMVMLFSLWTLGYGLCFAVTYGYAAYFWDNGIAAHLFLAAALWWLFGMWVIGLLVLFSSLLQNNTGVALCTGGSAALAYVLRLIPGAKAYSPARLMDAASLLSGAGETEAYRGAALVAAASGVIFIAAGVAYMNKRQV